MPKITPHAPETLTDEQRLAIAHLLKRVWPENVGEPSEMAERLRGADSLRPDWTIYMIWQGERAVASAQTFARTVSIEGEERTVLALAGVCVDPDLRGSGLGAEIVRLALAPVDDGRYELSLYQTGVPDFYRRLGACTVGNVFVNSHAEEPEKNPWWNDHVIVYPASAKWPAGKVDLLGPGY